MRLTEAKLSAELKAARYDRVYFIYGKEPFLISMYADRIAEAAEEPLDFNLQRLDELTDPDVLSEYVEALPVFSPIKVVTVKDFDPEKADAELTRRLLAIVEDIPETTVLVFWSPNIEIDEKKAKTKKFIAAVEKNGTICAVDTMKPPKIAELCVKKAAKAGIVLSPDDALYLTERVGGGMSAASDETGKLMSYVGSGGMITRESIEKLVPRQLDAQVFDLAAQINAGKRAEAYRTIDELFGMQIQPVNIMSALSGAYLDLYGAKLARSAGMSPDEAAPLLGFYGGRVWALKNKIFPAVTNLGLEYLRETVQVLFDADIEMKSSAVDNRTIIEETVTRLFMGREKQRRSNVGYR